MEKEEANGNHKRVNIVLEVDPRNSIGIASRGRRQQGLVLWGCYFVYLMSFRDGRVLDGEIFYLKF